MSTRHVLFGLTVISVAIVTMAGIGFAPAVGMAPHVVLQGESRAQALWEKVLPIAREKPQPPIARPGLPQTLSIPRLRINAPIEHVGIQRDGSMDTPSGWESVGWYVLGPRPGEPGLALIDGHLDSTSGTAVFWKLQEAEPGDGIGVTDDAGTTRQFIVREKMSVKSTDTNALKNVVNANTTSALALITCNGKWNDKQNAYSERLIVIAELVESSSVLMHEKQ